MAQQRTGKGETVGQYRHISKKIVINIPLFIEYEDGTVPVVSFNKAVDTSELGAGETIKILVERKT